VIGSARLGVEVGAWVPLRDVAALGRRIEEHEFDDIFMPEIGDPDAFITAGLVLTGTQRVRFGTCIVQIGPRSVPMIAMGAATLATAFPGRFALGIGVSSKVIVEGWHGVPWKKPLARADEAVRLLRALFAGETSNLDGEEISSKGFRLSCRPELPPDIQLAALNERMLRLAARVADGVWLNYVPRSRVPDVVKLIREEAAAHGRPTPEILLSLACYITEDAAEAEAKFREILRFYVASPDYRRALSWHGFQAEMASAEVALRNRDKHAVRAAITHELIDSICLIGKPAEVRDKLDQYWGAGIAALCVGADDESGLRSILQHLGKPGAHRS
jgi:probable F420-dependent oxidoreductase